MARGSSREKVAEWTTRLRRFEQADQTVAQFCVDEGVSPPSFYSWRTKLREVTPTSRDSVFQPVRIASCLAGPIREETVIRIGRDIEIELGRELTVVESIVQQLLTTVGQAANRTADATRSMEAESC